MKAQFCVTAMVLGQSAKRGGFFRLSHSNSD